MKLDADECLTPELASELASTLPIASPSVVAFECRRRVYFWGRWIKHGGYYPTWLLRVWRRGAAHSESRFMDEHMVLTKPLGVGRLRGDIIDDNHKGLSFWTTKHNGYADKEVEDLLSPRGRSGEASLVGQAKRRRLLKAGLYSRSPLFLRAFAYWLLRYVILLGFLDGLPGMVFHGLQGFWYRFLIDAKLYERMKRSNWSR